MRNKIKKRAKLKASARALFYVNGEGARKHTHTHVHMARTHTHRGIHAVNETRRRL